MEKARPRSGQQWQGEARQMAGVLNPLHRGERGAKESARSQGKSSPPSRLMYASPYTCSTFQREDAACAASAFPFSIALELQQDEDILSSKLELINFHLVMPSPSWSPSQAPCQDKLPILNLPQSSAQGGQRAERKAVVLGFWDGSWRFHHRPIP